MKLQQSFYNTNNKFPKLPQITALTNEHTHKTKRIHKTILANSSTNFPNLRTMPIMTPNAQLTSQKVTTMPLILNIELSESLISFCI